MAGRLPAQPAGRRRHGRTVRAPAAAGRRPALPGPLLGRGGAGPPIVGASGRRRRALPSTSTAARGAGHAFPRRRPRPAAACGGSGACRGTSRSLAGGPGTGKTTTVARLLALLAEQPRRHRRGSRWPPPRARPPPACRRRSRPSCPRASRRRVSDGRHPAPAAGLAARRPAVPPRPRRPAALRRRGGGRDVDGVPADDGPAARGGASRARLVLVGDPDQLASVEAGAVLGDLTRAEGGPSPRSTPRSPRRACPPGWSTASSPSTTSGASTARSPRSRGPCRGATPTPHWSCCAWPPTICGSTRPTRSPGYRRTSSRPDPHSPRPQRRARPGPRWPSWSATGCCARTGAVRSGWPDGLPRSTVGSPRPGAARIPGIRGGPFSSRPTTTTPGCSTATPASSSPLPTARGSRSPAAAHRRSTHRLGWATPRACT